ncbi:hypothetical protein [Bartonella birtlesii]|nr:hypothetical protein [Bartonella birtlesii]
MLVLVIGVLIAVILGFVYYTYQQEKSLLALNKKTDNKTLRKHQ